MSLRGRRFAGMKLAGQPVQNISQQLNDAVAKLNQVNVNETRGFPTQGFNESISVPGTDARVEIRASRTGLPNVSFDPSETTIIGNPDQIRLIAEKNKGDVFSLAWSVDGSYNGESPRNESPDERIKRVRIARAADRGFDKAIKGLPEGSLVENSPVGAGQGDFSRADIYMQKGFGPLQNDGLQYGLVENGKIRPVSPFVVNEEHAQHLAARAEKGGNPQLSAAIQGEIKRRKDLKIDDVYSDKRPDYDDDYGYDDYDEGPPPPITRAQFEEDLSRALPVPRTANGHRSDDQFPAGIGVRERARHQFQNAASWGRADDLTDEVISEGIRRVRERQIQDVEAGLNPAAGANMDLLQQLSPRSLPQPIDTADLEQMRNDGNRWSGSSVGVPRNTPVGERREAFINSIRERMQQYPVGWESDAGAVRQAAKRDLIDIYEETPGGRVVAQELFEPSDVEALRQWQANQHANWPIQSFGRDPAPPILDTQGRAMGPAQFNQHPDAPADPDAFRSGETNAQRRAQRASQINPLMADGREVQWRAAQPAGNYADVAAMRDVELTPSHMRVNVVMANDRLSAMIQNGTLPADTPRTVQAMQQAYGLEPNFNNLPQDLLRIRAFNGRGTEPSSFFDRDSAQALVNLNAAQYQGPNLLPDAVAAMGNQQQFNIGTAAPIRRSETVQPFNADYVNPIAAERDSRRARRRSPMQWEDVGSAPALTRPDAFTSSVRRQMEERAMQQADNIAPDPGWSLGTIRRVDPNSTRQDLDGISFAELGIDAQRRTQQRSQSPVPSGLSLDEFLDYTADTTAGNTVARAQPRETTRSGSISAALARPENRIVRRRRQTQAANDWSTAPLVPAFEDIQF